MIYLTCFSNYNLQNMFWKMYKLVQGSKRRKYLNTYQGEINLTKHTRKIPVCEHIDNAFVSVLNFYIFYRGLCMILFNFASHKSILLIKYVSAMLDWFFVEEVTFVHVECSFEQAKKILSVMSFEYWLLIDKSLMKKLCLL